MNVILRALAAALLLAGGASAEDVIRHVELPTRDLVYDQVGKKLWASIPQGALTSPDSVVPIDPVSGTTGIPIYVGGGAERLALSREYDYLYVAQGAAGSIRRVNLRTGSADNPFSLGTDAGAPYQVLDMAVAPNEPRTLAVVRYLPSTGKQDLVLYSGGVPGTQIPAWWESADYIEFGNGSSRLYGLNDGNGGVGFNRFAVDTSGITRVDGASALVHGRDMRYDAGRMYSNWGTVIDPEERTLLGAFAVPRRGPYGPYVAPDATVGRVFFLVQREEDESSNTWTLLAYDDESFRQIGALRVPGVHGIPSALVRWGANGIAFRDSTGIWLIESSLVSGPAEIDLSLSQRDIVDPAPVGKSLGYSLVVQNRGTQAAPEVVLTDTLPAGARLLSVRTGQGTWDASGGLVTVRLGTLAPGGRVSVQINVFPQSAGVYTNRAAVSLPRTEHNLIDNSSVEGTVVNALPTRNRIRLFLMAARDLGYSRATGRIYASLPNNAPEGNSLAPIDPITGIMETPLAAGSDPFRIAVSHDGRFAYAGLNGAGAVRRLDVVRGASDLFFSLGRDEIVGPLSALDIEAMPNTAGSIAVSRGRFDSSTGGVVVFDDGVPRNTASGTVWPPLIAYSESPARIYGHGENRTFQRLSVDGTGVTVQDSAASAFSGQGVDIEYAGGRVYSNTGIVIDPETRALIGSFPGSFPDRCALEVDATLGRAFFVTPSGKLLVFDTATFRPAGTLQIPGMSGFPRTLIRWGPDGLALSTTGGQIYLIQGPAVGPIDSPAEPGALTATPASSTSVRLSWRDQSDNEFGFTIERSNISTSGSGPFAQIATVGPDETGYTAAGLQPLQTYVFRVRAFNPVGTSGYSNEAQTTTLPKPPAAPNYLAAAGSGPDSIRLSWRYGGGMVEGYGVEQSKDGGRSFVRVGTTAAGVTSLTITGLTPRSTYQYRVHAYNAGGASLNSNVVSGTTTAS